MRNPRETTLEARSGALHIALTNGHVDHRPQWVMHCRALGIDTHPLQEGLTQEQAQREAMEVVRERLTDLAKCLPDLSVEQQGIGETAMMACGGDIWGECAQYVKNDWRYEVANNDTVLGYWDWVGHQAEADEVDLSSLTPMARRAPPAKGAP